MKNKIIFFIFFGLISCIFFQTISFSEEDHLPSVEKGYFGATVLLIDHETGDMGVRIEDEDTGAPMDMAFKVDVATVDISDTKNESLDFVEIQSGDIINFYTESNKDGKEHIAEITNTSRFASEQ